MEKLTVDIGQCLLAGADLYEYVGELDQITEEIENISKSLDHQPSLYYLKDRVQRIGESTVNNCRSVEKMADSITRCMDIYMAGENNICDHPYALKVEEAENTNFDMMRLFGISTEEIDDKFTNTLLTLLEKLKLNPGAPILKNLNSYIDSLIAFLKGDKSGFSGAEDLADLGKNSFGLWTSMYDYLASHDLTKQIPQKFGPAAAVVGILGSFMGILGKTFTASNTAGKSSGQIVGESIDVGTEIVGLVKNMCVGLSKGKVSGGYFTLAQTIMETISQTAESISEYAADGDFSMMDLGATAVDASVSGLAKLINGCTFGIIDIDAEYASDMLKDAASDWGNRAGNYILDNPDLKERYTNGNGVDRFGITVWSIFASAFGG